MPYQTCIDCGTREHSRCYNSTAVRINNDTGQGARPTDREKLESLLKQHNYCIKELTEMVMNLDVRIKNLQHVNEKLKLDNTGLWREFAELHTRMKQLERMV